MQIIAPAGPPALPVAAKIAAPVSLAGADFAAILAAAASPGAQTKADPSVVPTIEDDGEATATDKEIGNGETPDSRTTTAGLSEEATENPSRSVPLDEENSDVQHTEITTWPPAQIEPTNLDTNRAPRPKDAALPLTEVPTLPSPQSQPNADVFDAMLPVPITVTLPVPIAVSKASHLAVSSSHPSDHVTTDTPTPLRYLGGSSEALPNMPFVGPMASHPQPTSRPPAVQPRSMKEAQPASRTDIRSAPQAPDIPSAGKASTLLTPDATSQVFGAARPTLLDDGSPPVTQDQKIAIRAAPSPSASPPTPQVAAAPVSAISTPQPTPPHSTDPKLRRPADDLPRSFPASVEVDVRASTENPSVATNPWPAARQKRAQHLQPPETGAPLSQTDSRAVASSNDGRPNFGLLRGMGDTASGRTPADKSALSNQSGPIVNSQVSDIANSDLNDLTPRGDTAISAVRHAAAAASDPLHAASHRAAEPHRQVADAIVRTRDGMIEVLLDPVELGRVTVLLGSENHAGRLGLIVERPETLDLLRRHTDDLIRDLRDNGMPDARMDFMRQDSSGGQNRGQDLGDQSGAARALDPVPEGIATPQTAAPVPVGSGRLDIRL